MVRLAGHASDTWYKLTGRELHVVRLRPLLFDKGQGWLRWGMEQRWSGGYYLDPPEPYFVAPPLRRFASGARYLFAQVVHARFFWREGGYEWPWTYSKDLRDPERPGEVWRGI